MYATYQREYENFTHLPGESIDDLFQRFTVVVKNMRADVDVLPYDDHDRAVKLLHSLDRTVWGGKFEAIVESEKYDTLTLNELFSKLNSAEVDRGMTAKIKGPTDSHSLALIGGSKGKTNANPSTRMFSLSSLMSMPDEEFDVLGEDELALLMRRFERLHENRVNMRRNTRTCFQCGKPGHFIADCPEKVENMDSYKHKSRTDGKYRSRHDHRSKHKKKDKDERRSRKKERRGKARVMVRASDVDSSSAYSTSSSSISEDEGDRRKGRKSSRNLSGLSCLTRDGFFTMALSSGSKKRTQSNSGSDSDDEVHDELPFLRQENKRLGLLLDNRDDMLREAMKMRKELKASLEYARTRVAELETQNLDAKLEIDSLKASPVVSDEVECADCPIFLANLALFKEKHASKCEELDVLRVEVAELKSRSALLGACTSCPVLNGKIDEMHAYTVSLEAKMKEPIPSSCSTCDLHALKNLELVHYVDRLEDEKGELRKLMGWLSGHEPELRIMIETYKRQDGEGHGENKVGEGSGENILEPPKTYHKNDFHPKPNHLRNRLDTTPAPPVFPPQTNDFQKPIKFESTSGKVYFGKESEKANEEKPVEEPSGEKPSEQPHPKPKPKLVRFHCGYYGRDGHKDEFCFKRK
jgi:hypothetical protein